MSTRFSIDAEPWDAIYRAPLLVCPRCAGCCRAREVDALTRVSCRACAYAKSWQTRFTIGSADGTLPCWGPEHLGPWLVGVHRGHVLWATNVTHLDWLTAFVTADLRERDLETGGHNRAMGSRLPRWMKAASARPGLLRALQGLRERVPAWAFDEEAQGEGGGV